MPVGVLIGGALLGAVAGELLKLVIDVAKKTVEFRSILDPLQTTLTSLTLVFDEIARSNTELGLREEETEAFKILLEKGGVLVSKCTKINILKRYKYANKLEHLEASILKFYQINVQAVLWRNGIMMLKGMKDLDRKLDQLLLKADQTLLIVGQIRDILGGGVCGPSGFPGSCSVPRLWSVTVGLDEQVEELKVMLLKNDVSVVVISAPPGSGKTTLATKLCHDDAITGNFGANIFFVTISGTPNVKAIVRKLFEAMGHTQQDEFPNEKDLINELKKLIEGIQIHNMLLVLDDVWHEGGSIIDYFDFRIPGYKLLVTSRSHFPRFVEYKLKMLNHEDARTIFCRSAFPGGIPNVPDELVDEIVKGCKSSPLVLEVVGGSLYRHAERRWNETLKNWSKGQSVLDSNRDRRLDVIQTSLNGLDEYVKKCYLDLGSFPEDQRIPATVLRDMWVELYDQDEEGNDTVDYLYELSTRNLINFVLSRQDASGIECSSNDHYVWQHDLLRELVIHCSRESRIEERPRLIMDIRKNDFPSWWVEQQHESINAQLVSISTDETFSSNWYDLHLPKVKVLLLNLWTSNYTLPQFLERLDQLKAMIITNYGSSAAELSNFGLLGKVSNLRRIRLEYISIPTLNACILQMKNLQKLSLIMCKVGEAFESCTIDIPHIFPHLVEVEIDHSYDLKKLPIGLCNIAGLKRLTITYCQELVELPKGLGSLEKLEVLRLNSCTKLEELPESVGELCNLSLLDITDCIKLRELPLRMGELCCLESLHMRGCSGLKELPASVKNLRGLQTVVCNGETSHLWRAYEKHLTGLSIDEPKEDTSATFLRIMSTWKP